MRPPFLDDLHRGARCQTGGAAAGDSGRDHAGPNRSEASGSRRIGSRCGNGDQQGQPQWTQSVTCHACAYLVRLSSQADDDDLEDEDFEQDDEELDEDEEDDEDEEVWQVRLT